jgi:hypothetical protein
MHFTGRENDGTGRYYYRTRYYHRGLHSPNLIATGAGRGYLACHHLS